MKNEWFFSDYELINDEQKKKKLVSIVLIFIILGILIILYKFDFYVYQKNTLIKNDDMFYLIVDSKELNFYENQKYIYINQKKYTYDIVRIDHNYSNLNDIIYQTIYIKPYNYKTDAIITECKFLKSKKTIYEVIFEFIKGGKQ